MIFLLDLLVVLKLKPSNSLTQKDTAHTEALFMCDSREYLSSFYNLIIYLQIYELALLKNA